MKKPSRFFLISLLLSVFATVCYAGEPHPCARESDLKKVKQCFEALPLGERIVAFRQSMDFVAANFKDGEESLDVTFIDDNSPVTKEDAVAAYRQILDIFKNSYDEAKAQKKRLIFLGGESHPNRTCLMLGAMLNKIAKRFGTERFGFETAKESYVTNGKEPVHYKGLLEQIEVQYANMPKFPKEKEPLNQNYLGGSRPNQSFMIWDLMMRTKLVSRRDLCTQLHCWHKTEGRVGNDTSLFAADPMFWNWDKYPAQFGYHTSREPGMAITLIEQSLLAKGDSPVVAIYGYMHFAGIRENLRKTKRQHTVALKTLGFIDSLSVFNPKIREDMAKINRRTKYLIDNNILKKDGNIFIRKKEVPSALDAMKLAEYADRAVFGAYWRAARAR